MTGACPGFNGLTIPLSFTASPPNIRGTSGDNNQKCDVNGTGGSWYGSALACSTNIQIEVCCGIAIACGVPWGNAAMVFSLTTATGAPCTGTPGCCNAVNHGACVDLSTSTCASFTFNSAGTEGALINIVCGNVASCCNLALNAPGLKVVVTSP